MTNEEIYKDQLEAYLNSLLIINKSRLSEINFIEKQILHKSEEIIHINDQIELAKKLIVDTENELKKL